MQIKKKLIYQLVFGEFPFMANCLTRNGARFTITDGEIIHHIRKKEYVQQDYFSQKE